MNLQPLGWVGVVACLAGAGPRVLADEGADHEILNVVLRYASPAGVNDQATMAVDAGATRFHVAATLRESSPGPAALTAVPGQEKPHAALVAASGATWQIRYPTIVDLYVGPSGPYWAGELLVEAPEVGDWVVALHGVGSNVELALVVTERDA